MNETTAADVDAADDATRGRDAAGADAADPDAVVVGEGVRKSYGDVVALDGVDIRVESGEVFGLIGPNGAGKTTLVRALTGTTEAEGDLRVFGVPPREVDPQRIGLLPQSFDPPERLTATELVGYYGGLYDAARDAESVLRDVGMADDADVWYETLSGGQKRRTCVATAIVNDPDLLFLDEPTTGIDPAGRRSIHRLIERLAGGGTTVFLTSHAMDEVERLADRVALPPGRENRRCRRSRGTDRRSRRRAALGSSWTVPRPRRTARRFRKRSGRRSRTNRRGERGRARGRVHPQGPPDRGRPTRDRRRRRRTGDGRDRLRVARVVRALVGRRVPPAHGRRVLAAVGAA